jgi:hypothetical protein
MLDHLIWWCSIALEVLLLVRGLQGKLLPRYPTFYSYLLFVLVQSILRHSVHSYGTRATYAHVYWATEFLGVVIGCGVIFEIYRAGLRSYPGTARMARVALLLMFATATVIALVNASTAPGWWAAATVIDIERALRAVQALATIALALVFLVYSIPFGRNLRGMLLGYGLYIASSVIWLTFVYNGSSQFQKFWFYLYPCLYNLALGTWALNLWAYNPVPQPLSAVHLEEQYQRIAGMTRRRLQGARIYVEKAVRP